MQPSTKKTAIHGEGGESDLQSYYITVFKMSNSQQENKKLIETIPMKAQALNLLGKDFNCLIYVKRTEENHGQRTKGIRMVYEQVGSINKKIEIIESNQIEILKLKSTIDKIKSSLERFHRRFEQVEESISKFEGRATEIRTERKRNEEK